MGVTTDVAEQSASQVIDVDSVRGEFLAAVKEDGRSLMRIAPETGVAYGTLHPWSKGEYKGDNLRIAGQVRTWLTTRKARLQARKSVREAPRFVMTDTAARIFDLLEYAQTYPAMVTITASPGVGKTVAVNAYATQASNVWVCTAESVHRTATALLELLVNRLGVHREGRNYATSGAIQARLRNTRGLIVIDEAQHLTAPARDQLRQTVLDLAGVGVALVGSDEMDRTLSSERAKGQFAQFSSRIGQRFNRRAPLKRDVLMLLDVWGLTDPDAREVALGVAMKPGANRLLTMVLRMAFALADQRNVEQPTVEDVTRCFEQLGGQS